MMRIYCLINILTNTFLILWKRRKEARWAEAYIANLEKEMGGCLSVSAKSRVVVSYSGFIPMVANAFTQLHNRKTSSGEKERILLYFICSSLFDDFSDHLQLSQEKLYQISFHPELYEVNNFEESLFLFAYKKLKSFVKDTAHYLDATKRLFNIQINSTKQLNPNITENEIQQLTLEKGGFATFLCHFYLDDQAGKTEQDCWYLLGGVFQITDDLLDITIDLQEGIFTLPIKMKQSATVHHFYHQQIELLLDTIEQLPFPRRNKQKLAMSLMSVCSIGKLIIKKLQELEGKEGSMPDLHTVSRKALVIDMENPINIFRCIRYTYKDTYA